MSLNDDDNNNNGETESERCSYGNGTAVFLPFNLFDIYAFDIHALI